MFIVPLGVIWAGYALTYYGFSMVKGPGMGFADLIFPNPARIAKASGIIKNWGSSSASKPSVTAPSVPNTPGVQPGSPFYPANPKGGLPSKPPLGSTPPAGYS